MMEKFSSIDNKESESGRLQRISALRHSLKSFDSAVDDATVRLLRIALAFGFANAFASIAVAGASSASAVTLILGMVWLLLWGVAVAFPAVVYRLLEKFTWYTVIAVCAGSLTTILLTDGFDSYLKTEANWMAWAATVVLTTRMVMAVASLISASLLASFLVSGMTINEIVSGPDRYTAVTDIFNPFVIALAALALTGVFRDLFRRVPDLLAQMHVGPDGMPSLNGQPEVALLTSGESKTTVKSSPTADDPLTPAERAIVDQLASGRTPQQIALDSSRSEHTIYDHIKNAKRKVGALTTPHLVARAWRPTS